MKIKAYLAVGALAVVPLAAACSSASTQDELATALQEDASASGEDISQEDADCIAGVFIDFVGEEDAQRIVDDPDNADAVMEEAMGDGEDLDASLEFLTALGECNPEMFGMTGEDGEPIPMDDLEMEEMPDEGGSGS